MAYRDLLQVGRGDIKKKKKKNAQVIQMGKKNIVFCDQRNPPTCDICSFPSRSSSNMPKAASKSCGGNLCPSFLVQPSNRKGRLLGCHGHLLCVHGRTQTIQLAPGTASCFGFPNLNGCACEHLSTSAGQLEPTKERCLKNERPVGHSQSSHTMTSFKNDPCFFHPKRISETMKKISRQSLVITSTFVLGSLAT